MQITGEYSGTVWITNMIYKYNFEYAFQFYSDSPSFTLSYGGIFQRNRIQCCLMK